VHGDPGPGLDHHRHQRRPDRLRQRAGVVEVAQRVGVPAVLRLDDRQVVAGDHPDPVRDARAVQQIPVRGRRGGQPAQVLMQHRALEDQLGGALRRHQRAGRVEVALRPGEPAQLLVDRRPAHQHVGQDLVQAVPAGDSGRLVEQLLRRRGGQPGALGPAQRPQGESQRLR
jgi:hypothetical protein